MTKTIVLLVAAGGLSVASQPSAPRTLASPQFPAPWGVSSQHPGASGSRTLERHFGASWGVSSQRAGGRGDRPRGADPLVVDDRTGFESIFDGRTLKGWDGDPAFWRAEGGAIVGQSTAQNPLEQNTFLIWRGGEPADFELKVQFRMDSTNSGVQIRSVQVPPGGDVGKWVLKGYQADIDFENRYTGQIYEERGREFLAMRGQAVYIPDGGRPKVIGHLQQTADELKAVIKTNDWNQLHLVARGNTTIQILNGGVMSIVIDDDSKNRALKGLLGFQIHRGPPMKVEFRNIWLKELPPDRR
jgi:Domain of Unknown Function (DUF1080)